MIGEIEGMDMAMDGGNENDNMWLSFGVGVYGKWIKECVVGSCLFHLVQVEEWRSWVNEGGKHVRVAVFCLFLSFWIQVEELNGVTVNGIRWLRLE